MSTTGTTNTKNVGKIAFVVIVVFVNYKAALVRDLRSRMTALPGVSAVTCGREPNDSGGRRAAISLNRDAPSPANMRATLYYTWVQPNYFEAIGIPLSRGRGFRVPAAQADHDAVLSESAAHRLGIPRRYGLSGAT